ncbi:autotransporter adhesin/uncharacterized coiled-coil protein SlyX, partial [Lysobacter niastensis]
MNKIYRIVFNTVTGRWVVASEMAKGRRKGSRSAQVGATAALIGALATLPGMSHAAVVVNGNPQEGTVGCEYVQDQASATWINSSSSTYCIVAAGTGASGQGNPGKRAVFYSSDAVNGNEDSLNLGGYLDVWKTATFWGGANMQGTRITGLGAGLVSAASTEAINGGQLFDSNSAVAGAFGGTSTVNAAGNVTAPSYALSNANTIAGNTGAAGDVGTGFGKVDAALGKLNTSVTNLNNGSTRYFKAGGLRDGTDDAYTTENSVAAGASASAIAAYSGYNPTPYSQAVAIGNHASAYGAGAIAIGDTAKADYTNIALGAGADASGSERRSMALGINSKVTAWDAVALGASSVADRANTVSVGSSTAQRQIVNVAAGTQDTDAVNVSQLKGVTTALGGGAAVNATTGAIVAPSYTLSNANTIAGTTGAAGDVGTGFGKVDAALGKLNTTLTSITTGNAGIKYFHVNSGGADSTATGAESIAIGPTANAIGAASIAIGQRATMSATANNGVAIGGDSKAGDKSVSIGNGAATGASTWAVAAGTNATVTGQWGISIGGGSAVAGDYGVTVGTNSRASATNSAALGTAANASAVNSVALGANSTTTANLATAGYNPGSAALAGTASTANGEVSLGSATKERRLTNLAAGSAATDAINVSQLQAEDATVDLQGANTAAVFGGGSTYNAITGAISAPSYALSNANTIAGTTGAAGDVGTGFGKVDAALGTLNTSITNINDGAGIKYFHTNSSLADSSATGLDTVAVGPAAVSSGSSAVAIGLNANASAIGSVAIGSGSGVAAGATNGVAIGNATGVVSANSVALGQGSFADRANTVSVGAAQPWDDTNGGTHPMLNRQIVNVAAGTQDTDAVNVSQLKGVTAALGTTVDANGNIVAPQYIVTNPDGTTTTTYNNVASAVTNIDGRVTQNTTDITNITTQLNSGTVGLVQQAAAGADLTVGKDTDGAAVDFAGTTGARKLLNVEDGTVATGSKEAVNGGQLSATNDRVATAEGNITTLQGDVTNLDGRVTTAEGNITSLDSRVTTNEGDISTLNTNVSNIDNRVTTAEGNITSLDSRVTTNEGDITDLQTTVNNISSGTVGLVQQAATGANLTVGKDTDGAAVDFAGTTGARKLLNVEDGTVATGSKEAVNGGQLSATNDRVATAEGNITTLQGDVTNLDGRVTTAEGNITSLDSRVTTNEGDITNLDNRVTTNEGDISTLNTNVSNIDNRVTTAEGNITSLD